MPASNKLPALTGPLNMPGCARIRVKGRDEACGCERYGAGGAGLTRTAARVREVQKAQGENEVRSRGLIWKESDDGMDECVGGFM